MWHPLHDKSSFTTARSDNLEQFDVAYRSNYDQEKKLIVSIYHRKLNEREGEFFGTVTDSTEHWLGAHLWYIKPEHYEIALAEFRDVVEMKLIECGFFRGAQVPA